MIDLLYRAVKPILFRLDAETAHRLTLAMLAALPAPSAEPDSPELRTRVFGLDFDNPVGLAAGMDKDAIAVHTWRALGFGFAELGTITPLPQPGNPRPRIFRIREHRALINRLGFPSEGMDAVVSRAARATAQGGLFRIGLNFGPNKDTAVENAARDYALLMDRLGSMADFIVINVSSPNTPGLRNWQSPERMREIFAAIDGTASRKPILIKVAPDLERDDLERICETALELRLDGIVATNTTLARESAGVVSTEAGGLSGDPLRPIAQRIIREIRGHLGERLPIIGVGGIASAEDAYGHIRAGASLVELYTGLVYQGPGLVESINRGLAALLRRDGFRSISEAVGTAGKN